MAFRNTVHLNIFKHHTNLYLVNSSPYQNIYSINTEQNFWGEPCHHNKVRKCVVFLCNLQCLVAG